MDLSAAGFPFPVCILTQEGTILSCNSAAQQQFSSIQPLIGKTLFDIGKVTNKLDQEKSLVCIDHKFYLAVQRPIVSERKKRFMLLLLGDRKIVELLKQNDRLRSLNRELDAIIENSYDGIYITDRTGNTLKTNEAIERITGIPKDYYIGKNVKDLIKRGILKESATFKVLREKRRVTLVQRNFAGKETLMTGNPVLNENGEIEKVVTNIRDLSELNELNERLKKIEALNDRYKKEIERLKKKVRLETPLILESESMREIFATAARIADVETTVLILGETGTGKDVLARYIYENSCRAQTGAFVKVNCGAIPKDLLESELFGYAPGAFTGAHRSGKTGMFEEADGGVLFLDEIAELPADLQVKLLRVLQEKEIRKIGGSRSRKVNVRVVAATNKNLREMVKSGDFREDLYYRLHVLPFYLPPLRERKEDILPLVNAFLAACNEKYDFQKKLDPRLMKFFYHYDWPGNVRELTNLIERLVLTVPRDWLSAEDLPLEYRADSKTFENGQTWPSLKAVREKAEKELLERAAQQCRTTYEIAKKLQTSQATVVRKMQQYGLRCKIMQK